MPPSLLPDREQQICSRLRQVRLDFRFKQGLFAEVLGVSIDRLKSFEYARAPIRYGVAKRLCAELSVNQRWLATGQEPQRPSMDIPPGYELFIPNRLLFSHVYDRLLAELFENEILLAEAYGPMGNNAVDSALILPSGADWATCIRVMAEAIQQTFIENMGEVDTPELKSKLAKIEKLIGPFDDSFRRAIKHSLDTRGGRDNRLNIGEIQTEVLGKLGLTMSQYRSLNLEASKGE